MPTPEELKLMEKGADAAIQVARDYADVLMKPCLAEVGGILSDTVGYWRLKNQVSVLIKSKKLLEDNGIDPKAMLPDIFVPLIEAAGDFSDDLISDMFASLLTDHADPAKQDETHPGYAKILSQMSPKDASLLLLLKMYLTYAKARYGNRAHVIARDDLTKFSQDCCMPDEVRSMSADEINTAYYNAERLGIVSTIRYKETEETVTMAESGEFGFVDTLGVNHKQEFIVTEYGERFVLACTKYIKTDEFDVVIEKIKHKKANIR